MQICLANLCFLFTFASRKVTKTVYSVFGTCINKIKKQKWTITRRIILIRKAGGTVARLLIPLPLNDVLRIISLL